MPLSDIALNDTERSYTVCLVGVMYASKRICGRAGFSALRAVFLLLCSDQSVLNFELLENKFLH